jgi:hypothetical protein
MLDEINQSLKRYDQKWQALRSSRANQDFFASLKPVAIGWKTADKAQYDKAREELHDSCDRVIETWMNGRWIAKMHLKDSKLEGGITIVKVMQRRPDSEDALGLDHVDFYSPKVADAEEILKQEPDLKWSWESNDVIDSYDWISLWFDGAEAKLKSDTVLDIIQKELAELNAQIIAAA